jgi:hypothetical protein
MATRMTRSSMLDELNKEPVYTVRSHGLPEWKIIVRNHGARIARRLLSNTALIVSRLTFYAAFDATTFYLTAKGEISYLGALALINVSPAPWSCGEGGSVSTSGYALTLGAPWQIFEEGYE